MYLTVLAIILASISIRYVSAQQYLKPELTVHPLWRTDAKFENLVIRENGQILVGTVAPNASIYQIDPLGIIPPTLIYTIPNTTGAVGLAERSPGLFYAATTYPNVHGLNYTIPTDYGVEELDLRKVQVLPNGKLSLQPQVKRAASIPQASLLNGVAFSRPGSEQLLVADSYRGLIYNVNVCTGVVTVAFEYETTRGNGTTGSAGINGLKVYNNTMYWSNIAKASLFAMTINANGIPFAGAKPELLAEKIMAGVDDFVVDHQGNIFLAGPYNALLKVRPSGQYQIIAGTVGSNSSSLGGPTAVQFGKLGSDQNSLYVTTNGGLLIPVFNSSGVSRVDLGRS